MPEPLEHFTMNTPVGVIELALQGNALQRIELFNDNGAPTTAPAISHDHPVYNGLRQYFHDPRQQPQLAMKLQGTAFQKRVWRALQAIPPGQTRTYGDIAGRLNTSARAVGNACRANPLPLVIPCHRVVAAGHAGGFAGARSGPRTQVKHWLLNHEKGVCQ